MIRTYPKHELDALKREAFAQGREDSLLGTQRALYSPNSVGDLHYQKGRVSGKEFRAFLDARGMRWIQQIVRPAPPSGWKWKVKVEGELKAEGSERSEKKAYVAAENAAILIGETHA